MYAHACAPTSSRSPTSPPHRRSPRRRHTRRLPDRTRWFVRRRSHRPNRWPAAAYQNQVICAPGRDSPASWLPARNRQARPITGQAGHAPGMSWSGMRQVSDGSVPGTAQLNCQRQLAQPQPPSHGRFASLAGLWVPKTLSPYATWAYSRIRPPSRSRRKTRTFARRAGGCGRPAGGLCCSARCGR